MRKPALLLAAFALAAPRAGAVELGACGNGSGVQSIIASAATGAVVGAGLEAGVVIYQTGPWRRDDRVIEMPYGAGLLAEPNGRRFALLKDKAVHLYAFAGFKRLSKSSAPVLKDQSVLAWTWIDGTDGVAIFSSVVKSGAFGLGGTKKTPYLLRLDVATGSGSQVPLAIPGGYLSASFDAMGERVAIGFSDGHVQVHRTSDGGLVASYAGHATPWNSLGLAFHPAQSLLASSDGQKLILFDLEARRIGGTHPTQDGSKLLQWVADGQFLIAADTTNLSLLDPMGRRLETRSTDDSYQDFYVADPLRKVFSLRGNLVCWQTFERWGRVPFVARGGSAGGAPPAPADVVYRNVPLSTYFERLRTGSGMARLDALDAIEKIGPPAAAAVPDLVKVLTSPEWTERATAARALGSIGPAARDAVSSLETLRGDPEETVRAAVSSALEKIAGKRS